MTTFFTDSLREIFASVQCPQSSAAANNSLKFLAKGQSGSSAAFSGTTKAAVGGGPSSTPTAPAAPAGPVPLWQFHFGISDNSDRAFLLGSAKVFVTY